MTGKLRLLIVSVINVVLLIAPFTSVLGGAENFNPEHMRLISGEVSVANTRIGDAIELGQKAVLEFNILNPTTTDLTTKVQVDFSTDLPKEFQAYAFMSFAPNHTPAIFNLTIPASGEQHITVLVRPVYDWNKPYRADCEKVDYTLFGRAFTDYAQDIAADASGIGSIVKFLNYLQDSGSAAKILLDTTKVRPKSTFTLTPKVSYISQGQSVVVNGDPIMLHVTVPDNKINQFSRGVTNQLDSLAAKNVGGFFGKIPLGGLIPNLW